MRPYLVRRLKQLAALCFLGVLSPLVAAYLPADFLLANWFVDLLVHWQVLYVVLGWVAAAALAWLHRRSLWLLAAPLYLALPAWTASPRLSAANSGAVLTVASANVHVDNRNAAEVLAWLRQQNVDVAVLLEVSPDFAQALASSSDYPYRVVEARSDPFGVAVVSRLALTSSQVLMRDGRPYLRIATQAGQRSIALYALHPMPPLEPAFRRQRDELLTTVAAQARNQGVPTLLVGDFNASPWASVMRTLSEQGFHRATGLQATWPAVNAPVVGMRLDQLFASPHWRVAGDAVGPRMASDHRPIVVRLTLGNESGG